MDNLYASLGAICIIFIIVYVGNLDKGQGLLCIISIMVIGNLDMDLGGSLDYFRNN